MFLVRILHTTAVIVLVWPEHHLYPNKRRGVLVYFFVMGNLQHHIILNGVLLFAIHVDGICVSAVNSIPLF